ncbi:hypothetical protein D3C86_1827410 [compost metagenome]
MPMNTTFFTGRKRRASATWATISAVLNWRSRPLLPVMQNTQPTAQPTWLETHRPSRGSSTLSTICLSASSTSKRAEPSAAGCSELRRARALSSSVNCGRALRTASGRKFSVFWWRVPLSSGLPCSQARMIRPICWGLPPRAASCC